MGANTSSKLVSFIGISVFLLPIGLLFYFLGSPSNISGAEITWALRNTFSQSFLSLGLVFFGALIGGFGLLSVPLGKRGSFFRLSLVIPYFLPPIFIILAGFQIFPVFPRGVAGIAILHAWMNIGMASILFERFLRDQFSSEGDAVQVYGISWLSYVWFGILPRIGSFVRTLVMAFFPLFFASFTIPLVVGGNSGTTIEVLIFEKMRLGQDWSGAVILSFIQILIQAAVLFAVLKPQDLQLSEVNRPMEWLGKKVGAVFLVIVYGLFIFSFFASFLGSVGNLGILLTGNFAEVFWGSVVLTLVSGILFFLLTSLICFLRPGLFMKFIGLYNPPGSALLAFGLLILGLRVTGLGIWIVYFGFFLLFLPLLLKTFILPKLHELQDQINVAQVFSASDWQIFRYITFPQIRPQLVLAASVASIWCLGDFSISRILSSSDWFFGLMAGSLLGSYRLELAGWLCFGILVFGILNYLLLNMVSIGLEKLSRDGVKNVIG